MYRVIGVGFSEKRRRKFFNQSMKMMNMMKKTNTHSFIYIDYKYKS